MNEVGMQWRVDVYVRLLQKIWLPRVLAVYWVVIPVAVVLSTDPLDSGLRDRIAAREAWKLVYEDRAANDGNPSPNAVEDCVNLGVTDPLQFLVVIREQVLVVEYAPRQAVKPGR